MWGLPSKRYPPSRPTEKHMMTMNVPYEELFFGAPASFGAISALQPGKFVCVFVYTYEDLYGDVRALSASSETSTSAIDN